MSLRKRNLIFLIILFGVSSTIFAQSDSIRNENESSYYLGMNGYFNLSADLETEFETFDIKGTDFEYDIRPNFDFVNLIGIDYRAFSFFASFTPNIAANDDQDLRGESRHNGFGISFNTSTLLNHVSTSSTEGYYLKNSADFDLNFQENITPNIQFPELKVTSLSGSHALKLNKNFSYGAFSAQMGRQLKSAGTLAPGVSYNYYKVDNRTPTGQRSKNFELLVNLPYYYTHVIDQKWYLNIGLMAGAGRTHTQLTTIINAEPYVTAQNTFVARGSARIGLGYNSQGFYAGIDAKANRRFQGQNNNSIKEEITGLALRVFIGFHIKAPKKLNDLYSKVESSILGS